MFLLILTIPINPNPNPNLVCPNQIDRQETFPEHDHGTQYGHSRDTIQTSRMYMDTGS